MKIHIKLNNAADQTTMVPELHQTDQFILFGDSITQRSFNQERGFAFGAALTDDYVRRLDIINRGFSGYNTRQALQILPHILPSRSQSRVRFLTLWYGANDARLPHTPGEPQQHIPLEEFVRNTKIMLSHPDVRGHEGIRIVLMTPPPVDERQSLLFAAAAAAADQKNSGILSRKACVTRDYAAAIVRLVEEDYEMQTAAEIQVLDVWSLMIRRAGGALEDPIPTGALEMPQNEVLQSFLVDGLHLSPAGYRVVYEEFVGLIRRVWPDQTPERLPFVFPAWDDDVWKRV